MTGAPPSRLLIFVVAALAAVPLLWPGDAPWINDEPRLVVMASDANQAGRWADGGLTSVRGARYGPLPVWMYQLFLRVSPDPRMLVFLKAAVSSAATAIALLWLARTLRLWPWFVPVVMLSPYLWFHHRLAWDNVWCIPLGALGMAAYAAFIAHRARGALALALGCMGGLLLTHLMSLPLVIAVSMHLLWIERGAARRHPVVAIGAAAVIAWIGRGYWPHVFSAPPHVFFDTLDTDGWWYPLSGGQALSAAGFEYFIGQDWQRCCGVAVGVVTGAAILASLLAHGLVWLGLLMAAYRVATLRRRRPCTLDHVAAIALGTLVFQSIIDGLMRIGMHPHYFNGTWIVFVLFAWLGIDAMRHGPLASRVAALHAAGLSIPLLLILARIHVFAGARDGHHGPTLAEQMRIAEEIERHAPAARVVSEDGAPTWGIECLQSLRPRAASHADAGPPRLLRYRSSDVNDAHLSISPAPSPTPRAPS